MYYYNRHGFVISVQGYTYSVIFRHTQLYIMTVFCNTFINTKLRS
jgi:hypothetical protein